MCNVCQQLSKRILKTRGTYDWLTNLTFKKKLKGKKTHNSRKKLNDLTKFTERRKKLKYFCLQKYLLPEIYSIFIQKKTMLPSINSIFMLRNSINSSKFPAWRQNSRKKLKGSTSLETQVVENRSNLQACPN